MVGQINLTNLDAKEPEPTAQSLEWDASVDTYAELTYINTADISGTSEYLVKADETANNTGRYTHGTAQNLQGQNYKRTTLQRIGVTQIGMAQILLYMECSIVRTPRLTNRSPSSTNLTHWTCNRQTCEGHKCRHRWMETVHEDCNRIYKCWNRERNHKISTKLYDYSQDASGFAGADNFDDNFFDQEPSIETRKVLTALRDDLFINDLAGEYNTLFFTGLRKVLSEQTYVDWMFKTSFINAKNSVRQLDQRKTYTTGTDSWIESYINEVKPFHTKLREYTLGYDKTETQDGLFSDFDNPTFYDATTGKIRSLNVDLTQTKLTQYPYQMWYDYHKKYVQSITVTAGGSGYTKTPTVTIVGGTVASTGPFQILATSSSGSTSGSYGYYYPLFTSQEQAEIWDIQNGGAGTTNTTHSMVTQEHSMDQAQSITAQSTIQVHSRCITTPATTAATATATVRWCSHKNHCHRYWCKLHFNTYGGDTEVRLMDQHHQTRLEHMRT